MISPYKVIRFIDRLSWDAAKLAQKAPNQIYGPAPMTWDVWSQGLESLFPKHIDLKNLKLADFSLMNKVLLTNGTVSIKDDVTDETKAPGEFRGENDSQIAFCSHEPGDHRAMAEASLQSLLQVQSQFEKKIKMPFTKLVEKEGGSNSGIATLGASLRSIVPGCGPKADGIHVSYVRSEVVISNMEWIRIFIKANLKLSEAKSAFLAPIELSALVQKWFVTVHPFADGNGRTSRGLQDLILENYDLPFVPGGDLQNDALEEYRRYAEQTYVKTEALLTKLEECVQQYKSGSSVSFECKTTSELNK